MHDVIAHNLGRQGRVWKTLWKLLSAPGALTIEYVSGVRTRYLRPLQIYLAASLVVFALAQLAGLDLGLKLVGQQGIYLLHGSLPPSGNEKGITSNLSPLQFLHFVDTAKVRHFESLSKEDRFRVLRSKRIQYISSFVLFLVPLFSFILAFVYRDRRRLYGEHLIFGLHAHSFALAILLTESVIPAMLANALSLWLMVYLVVALKRVYGGTWAGSVGRGTAVGLLYFITYFVGNFLLILTLLEL